jgi:hypothetical protein
MEADTPVAWVRRHPDWTLTTEFLAHAAIEPSRKQSGAWVPLFTRIQLERAVQKERETWQARAQPASPPSVSVDEELLRLVKLANHGVGGTHSLSWQRDAAAAIQRAEASKKPIMTFDEFIAEGTRLGITMHDLAPALAARPEFADCLPTDPAKSAEHARAVVDNGGAGK